MDDAKLLKAGFRPDELVVSRLFFEYFDYDDIRKEWKEKKQSSGVGSRG